MSRENVGQNRLAMQIASWKGQIADARTERLKAEEANHWYEGNEAASAHVLLEVIAEATVTLVDMEAMKYSESIYSGSEDGTDRTG